MKKLLFLFIGLLLSLISIMGQTIVTYNGLRYQIENNTAIVGRQDKELSGDIVIPSSIICNGETYTVTGFVQPTNLTAWSGNTVTTEGGAFQSCQITSVEIPSSITTIAAGTFSGCHNLKRVKMEDNLEEIGAASFSDCTSLESIYIPDNVNSFGSYSNYGYVSYTFGGCSNLKTIIIPSKITVLLEGCFMGSGLEKIVIPKTITKLCDNCLFSKKLKEVKMEIADLSKLSYSPITFGSANEIDIDLFVPKGSISVYQEYEPWSNFMSIQEYGDEGEIFVPDQININYSGLRYIIKNGEATVARQSSSLSGNIVIPDKVRYKDVEYPVTSMIEPTDLVCYSNNTINCTGGAFQGSEIESISIPSSIISISAGAFQNCLNLKKVVLPSTVKILSAASFAGCENLEDINLPEGLTDLASGTKYGYRSYVFGGCLKIKSIEIPLGVKSLASGCFKNSGLENVSIPANCISMGNDCLNAPNLQTVTMYVRDLDKLSYTESCFGDVSNTTLRVPNGSRQVYKEYYPWRSFAQIEEFDDGQGTFVPSKIVTTVNNIRYILEGESAMVGRQNKELSGDIIIPSYIEFEGKEYLINSMVEPTELIAWSSNMVSTENGAFQSCPITSVKIPSTISVIPAGAFYGCEELEMVSLEEGITELGAACFAGCTKLEELKIPESVEYLGSGTKYGFKSYIFGNCRSLKKVNIPAGVTALTEGCFKGSGLETFIIPSNVVLLQEDCFSINSLKAIKITHTDLNNLTYTESIFSNVSNVSLYVPEGTSNLYKEFYPWKNFKEIVEYTDQNDDYFFNAYSITYLIPSISKTRGEDDNEIYKINYIASGIDVEEIETPTIKGYTFIGWNEIPEKMPARDIFVTGLFSKNEDKVYEVSVITDEKELIKSLICIEVVDEDTKTAVITAASIPASEAGSTEIAIPSNVGGYTITAIETNAFAGMTGITDIYFPDTDQPISLGTNALKIDDEHVATVHVPVGLLGSYAFNNQLAQNFNEGKVKATVTAPNRYWTFSAGVDVVVPEGVGVYICKYDSEDKVIITELDDSQLLVNGKRIIKANNGVLVACNNGTGGDAYDIVANPGGQSSMAPASYDAKSYGDDNMLEPVIVSKNYPATSYYVLKNGEFHKILANSSKMPAGKAVLRLPGVSNVRILSIIGGDDDTTGIYNRPIIEEESKWFDLQGRRIERPVKAGLYIKNGKKVVIK